jgi:hypothetical protein
MPPAITVTISFAEPVEDVFGDFIIPPGQIYTRTVATDRIKKINYQFVRQEFEPDDPNELSDPNEPDDNMEDLDEIDTDKDTGKAKTAEVISEILKKP